MTEEIALNPLINRTGDVWHVFLKGDLEDMVYGYRVDGSFSPEDGFCFDSSKILIDPYAKVSRVSLFERCLLLFAINSCSCHTKKKKNHLGFLRVETVSCCNLFVFGLICRLL